MGSLILIDVYDKLIKENKFIVSVVYSLKAKNINRIYTPYDKELFERIQGYINEDVTSYIFPKIKSDGTAGLDINI